MTVEEARTILAKLIDSDGSLSSFDAEDWEFLSWHPGDETIVLDGGFTLEQLEAMVTYLKARALPCL